MISLFYNGTKPETFGIQNGVVNSITNTLPDDPIDLCYCSDSGCDRVLKVFASTSSNSERQNDKTSFLYRLMSATDTGVIKLFKNDVEIETLNNNNFGTYYPVGSLSTGNNPQQDLYFGYLLNWKDVLTTHGVGEYYIETELTLFGTSTTIESEKYRLYKYSDEAADGTVKLVTYQNGNIESNTFDFTGLNWYQQIRISGILWNKQSEYITDTYFTSNRSITQIQDSIEHTYDLQIEFVSDQVSKFIIENNLLANQIFVSDYNLENTSYYNEIPLAVKEIADTTELYYFNGRSHVIQFTDRVQNIRKRNYK